MPPCSRQTIAANFPGACPVIERSLDFSLKKMIRPPQSSFWIFHSIVSILNTQPCLEAIESVENALYQECKQGEFPARLEHRHGFLERTVIETKDRYAKGL